MRKIIMALLLTVGITSCNNQVKKTENSPEHKNPFLTEYSTPFEVPPFEEIEIDDYKPAFLQAMEEQKQEIDSIVNNPESPDFENTIVALDQSGKLLRSVSAVFYGLNSANTNDSLQALSKELSPLMSKHNDDIMLNPELFARVKAVYDKYRQEVKLDKEKAKFLNLNKEEAKLLEETYKDFVRGGANLPDNKKAELRNLNSAISLLQINFGQNMLKETNDFKLIIDKEEDLAGLPENLISVAAEEAKKAGQEGKWIFTLHNPSVMPFLQFSENRALREKIFNGYINRGNNNNEADNKEIVKQLVTKRLEKAKLMGFGDYASFVLEERMAKSNANVYKLLDEVWTPALVKTKEEAAELQAMMKKEGLIDDSLKGWDWRYYGEKVMKDKFDIDENAVRPYFKLDNVLNGLFQVANRLYGLTFTEIKDIPKPYKDAMAFECKDPDGAHRGVLYMDFFPRESKRGGAWCGTYRSQTYKEGKKVNPVVTIVCNFTKAADGKPALLSIDEATTMFHEFGHALHNLFKDVHYYGISSVPRDFVELPSQIMEHWVLEPEVLKIFAKHYKTGEEIPQELVEKIINSSKQGQGFATSEYVQASLLDMDYHTLKEIPKDLDINKFEAESMNKRGALSQIPPRYRSTYFNHTMGGGYTAGYYSYMWAEVLDADAFEAFKETGDIFNPDVAKRFREYVLTPGSIDDASVMYRNFRGKDPSIDPLLRNRGLK